MFRKRNLKGFKQVSKQTINITLLLIEDYDPTTQAEILNEIASELLSIGNGIRISNHTLAIIPKEGNADA